jgi:hypothetical protein
MINIFGDFWPFFGKNMAVFLLNHCHDIRLVARVIKLFKKDDNIKQWPL